MRTLSQCAVLLAFMAITACARNQGAEGDEPVPRPDPIPVHVKNENFLDMNVYAVTTGSPRRLGTVSGNSAADFRIEWALVFGQAITITAVPIGGRGTATSGPLNVGPGQMIDFRIGATLRQSVASVHEP